VLGEPFNKLIVTGWELKCFTNLLCRLTYKLQQKFQKPFENNGENWKVFEF
jgi:hypothetical protein